MMLVVAWLQVDYFDVYNGFAAIGGISLMICWFVGLAMLLCEAGTNTRYPVVLKPHCLGVFAVVVVFSLFLCM